MGKYELKEIDESLRDDLATIKEITEPITDCVPSFLLTPALAYSMMKYMAMCMDVEIVEYEDLFQQGDMTKSFDETEKRSLILANFNTFCIFCAFDQRHHRCTFTISTMEQEMREKVTNMNSLLNDAGYPVEL